MYGEWIGNRYKQLPSIIWVGGGYHNPTAGAITFAEDIAAVDATHVHTFHAHPGKSSAALKRLWRLGIDTCNKTVIQETVQQ